MRTGRLAVVTGLVGLFLASVSGCGTSDDQATITVFAAASLTDVMADLARAFEATESGARVEVNAGPSSALRESILAGAPADVFASADAANMAALAEAGAVGSSEIFATNVLTIVVPSGNPAGITGLGDFGRRDLLIGLCAPQVPCGAFAREALAGADVDPQPDTEASDVRALLTQVASGDLDAGIVYRSDVLAAADEVEAVAIAARSNVTAEHPIAVLGRSPEQALSRVFVDFVRSAVGQEILADAGFGAP